MNKVLILLLAMIVPIFSQVNWGGNTFTWADSFYTTDSLQITAAHTYLITPDTLYTKAMDASFDEDFKALWQVAFYSTAVATVDTSSDSIFVDARKGINFGPKRDPYIEWGPWVVVLGPMADSTLYMKNVALTDSILVEPCNIIQYRVYDVDADATTRIDTIVVFMTDFRH